MLYSFLHRECCKTSFIRCFIVTAENLVGPVVFLFFCSWWPAEEYLFAALRWDFFCLDFLFFIWTFTNYVTAREGGGYFLTRHYQFHPLHRHLDIRRAITAGSSPLHIASSRTRTGNRDVANIATDWGEE